MAEVEFENEDTQMSQDQTMHRNVLHVKTEVHKHRTFVIEVITMITFFILAAALFAYFGFFKHRPGSDFVQKYENVDQTLYKKTP